MTKCLGGFFYSYNLTDQFYVPVYKDFVLKSYNSRLS